jgi:hypothetical protein
MAHFPKRGYCVWCKKQAQRSKSKTRPVWAEIFNGATPTGRQRSSRSHGGFIGCKAFLCKMKRVSSSIIAIIIMNSSLLLTSLIYLAPRTIDANNRSQNGRQGAECVRTGPFRKVHSAKVHSAFRSWHDFTVVICMEHS